MLLALIFVAILIKDSESNSKDKGTDTFKMVTSLILNARLVGQNNDELSSPRFTIFSQEGFKLNVIAHMDKELVNKKRR